MDRSRLKILVDKAIKTGPLTSVAVVMGGSGAITHEFAAGEKTTSSTIFDTGSMTQSLATAPLFMSLSHEHNINLNTPVSLYWPDFSEGQKKKITLRHLLKNTSGLARDRPFYRELIEKHSDWIGTNKAREFILNNVAADSLEYPPTYTQLPSNVGFLVLGYLAELIGGESLNALFDKIVAKPLCLKNTGFGVPPDKRGRCAASFTCPERNRLLRGEAFDLNSWAIGGIAGHAGLFTTAAEAVKIGTAIASSFKNEGGLLPRSTVMAFLGPKTKYKLGFETPDVSSPLCGMNFSRNTVGHVSTMGTSLWIDLDKELAIAVFAAFHRASQPDDAVIRQFSSLLPEIHNIMTAGEQ